MKLRALKEKDASMMLEWMHDPKVNEKFRADFASMTIEDVHLFIRGGRTQPLGITRSAMRQMNTRERSA